MDDMAAKILDPEFEDIYATGQYELWVLETMGLTFDDTPCE